MTTPTIRVDPKLDKALDRIAKSSGQTFSITISSSAITCCANSRKRCATRAGCRLHDQPKILEFITGEAAALIEQARPVDAKVDPDDAVVLGEAQAGGAQMFVTGDAAVLKVGKIEAMNITTPRQFWEALHTDPG